MYQIDQLQLLHTVEMLMDTNVFIADTGSSVDIKGTYKDLSTRQNQKKVIQRPCLTVLKLKLK